MMLTDPKKKWKQLTDFIICEPHDQRKKDFII